MPYQETSVVQSTSHLSVIGVDAQGTLRGIQTDNYGVLAQPADYLLRAILDELRAIRLLLISIADEQSIDQIIGGETI